MNTIGACIIAAIAATPFILAGRGSVQVEIRNGGVVRRVEAHRGDVVQTPGGCVVWAGGRVFVGESCEVRS